ncbi:MAG: hypothetical protein K1000chlam1_01334 [Candidatus Anoxychlamydiales bacterium]|nr:hypothetical protein [Candidatus Anoxychlamydiales bacterium]
MACLGNILSKPIAQVASDCASGFVETSSNIIRPIANQGIMFSYGAYNYGLEGAGAFVSAALILGSRIYCTYKCMENSVLALRNYSKILVSKNYPSRPPEYESESLLKSHGRNVIVYAVGALSLTAIGIANMGMYLQSAYRLGKQI